MANIIDRRTTYNKNKNATNRQRYLDRIKDQVRENVNTNITKGNLKDLAKGDKIKVRVKDTKEPTFVQDSDTGINDTVVPGNPNFERGDKISKPQKGGGGRSRKGSLDEDSVDDIVFTLTKDEFLDILFEDLELPDLVKKDIRGSTVTLPERRGYTTSGNPSNLDVVRSYKNSLGRRIALNRPSKKKIKELEVEYEIVVSEYDKMYDIWTKDVNDKSKDAVSSNLKVIELLNRKLEIESLIEKAKRKSKSIPYLDEIDVRFRRFDRVPKPITNSVMFCMMDVSGSMGEHEKDIAKRFFLLLYLFLNRKYEKVDIVFIRHTTHAEEVDENTFFYDPLSGGTQISSGLELINEIIDARYDIAKTNIYVAQASDGGNYSFDNQRCYDLITQTLLDKLQYFAYVEIIDPRLMAQGYNLFGSDGDNLWDYYKSIEKRINTFKARQVSDQSEIFTVFKDLFAKKESTTK